MKSRRSIAVLGALALSAAVYTAPASAHDVQTGGVVGIKAGLLTSVTFRTTQRGWVGGEHVVLSTSDGGHTWTRQYAGAETIQQLDFVSDTAGWALGARTLLRTSDGGHTWTLIGDPRNALRQVDFVTPTQGWGIAGSYLSQSQTLYRTQDGGVIWRRQATPQPTGSACFVDAAHGWIAASGTAVPAHVAIFATANSGATWHATTLPPGMGGLGSFVGQTLGCAGPNAVWDLVNFGGYAGGAGYALYQSADGGAHWRVVAQNMALPTIQTAHGPGTEPGALAVTSAMAAHLTGTCGPCGQIGTTTVGGTTNGGLTWHNQDVPGLPFATTALSFPTARDGWLVAQWFAGPAQRKSAVFATTDGGLTWQQRYHS